MEINEDVKKDIQFLLFCYMWNIEDAKRDPWLDGKILDIASQYGISKDNICYGELLSKENQWISVSDMLPPDPINEPMFENYIVMIKGAKAATELSYEGGGKWYYDESWTRYYCDVSHWRKFPEPPIDEDIDDVGTDTNLDIPFP